MIQEHLANPDTFNLLASFSNLCFGFKNGEMRIFDCVLYRVLTQNELNILNINLNYDIYVHQAYKLHFKNDIFHSKDKFNINDKTKFFCKVFFQII